MQVLLYNLSGSDEIKVKNLCRMLHIAYREIQPEEFGYTLGYLLGASEDDSQSEGEVFTEPMLYLSDLYGMLDIFLNQLRRNKVRIPLKAVRTDTNMGFSSFELYRELSAERAAIEAGMKAHKES